MKVAKVQTFYRNRLATPGSPWASCSTAYLYDVDGTPPAGAWTPGNFALPGVNPAGQIQAGQGTQADNPLGNAIRLLVAQAGTLALQIGWQHVVFCDVDAAGVITDTEVNDVIANVVLATTGDNTGLFYGIAAPNNDQLTLPDAILWDKRVDPPLVTSNGRNRRQAGRSYVAYANAARNGVIGTNAFSISATGGVVAASQVLVKVEDARIDAEAASWNQCVVSAPNGFGVGDVIQARPIVSYSVDGYLGVQRRRLLRDNASSALVS